MVIIVMICFLNLIFSQLFEIHSVQSVQPYVIPLFFSIVGFILNGFCRLAICQNQFHHMTVCSHFHHWILHTFGNLRLNFLIGSPVLSLTILVWSIFFFK